MENDTKEAVTSTVAVEEGQKATPALEGGEKVTQPIEKKEEFQPFKVFKTQTDFDNEAAKIKGSSQREFFKKAGVKDFAELEKMKEAYQAQMTEAEKMAKKLEEAEETQKQNQYKDYIITALATKANIPLEDVGRQVAMAKGLITEGICSDFQEALNIVIGGTEKKVEKPTIPQGKNITQPDVPAQPIKNPFKKGSDFSLQAQTELFKKDKELAKRLASEAGINL